MMFFSVLVPVLAMIQTGGPPSAPPPRADIIVSLRFSVTEVDPRQPGDSSMRRQLGKLDDL